MAKLIILNQGMTGRAHELAAEKTTIGRVEDNSFQIVDPSVSSHHCEALLRGSDVVIHDLNSTNGSFINGEKIAESVLKPGQTLRLGQVELRLEVPGMPAAPAPASAPAPAAPASAPAKKSVDTSMVSRGVSLSELERGGGTRPMGFDSSTVFSKKKKQGNKYFLIGGIVVAAIIVILILILIFSLGGGHK
ncbi:MAG TPA: FHA domain-containing protein [Verrucomicrobiae bacterium]|nr:FHA domain-containing protein [Verrucomicrobiae bacterium]